MLPFEQLLARLALKINILHHALQIMSLLELALVRNEGVQYLETIRVF